ncbi:MAG: hypothetical protein IKB80_06095 [Oscillospiraceae bacterium]|nr:hypothetical protein [Oscillospiraceae bacterium]
MENGGGIPAKPYDKVAEESGRGNRKMTCEQAFLLNRQHYAERKTQAIMARVFCYCAKKKGDATASPFLWSG